MDGSLMAARSLGLMVLGVSLCCTKYECGFKHERYQPREWSSGEPITSGDLHGQRMRRLDL